LSGLLGRQQPLDDRNRESSGLPGSGPAFGDHIFAVENEWNGAFLQQG
jgi:hypothetical protein